MRILLSKNWQKKEKKLTQQLSAIIIKIKQIFTEVIVKLVVQTWSLRTVWIATMVTENLDSFIVLKVTLIHPKNKQIQ